MHLWQSWSTGCQVPIFSYFPEIFLFLLLFELISYFFLFFQCTADIRVNFLREFWEMKPKWTWVNESGKCLLRLCTRFADFLYAAQTEGLSVLLYVLKWLSRGKIQVLWWQIQWLRSNKFLFFIYFLCDFPILFLFFGCSNSYFPIFLMALDTWHPGSTNTSTFSAGM
jgi:hypothetical protein